MSASGIGNLFNNFLTIEEEDQTALLDYHHRLSDKVPWATLSGAAASFLLIGAIIVIFSASMLFTLPNVNVIQHILLPGYLPGGGGILLSIPFIVTSVLLQRRMNQTREEWINTIGEVLHNDDYLFDVLPNKMKVKFIENNLFPPNASNDYKEKLISDIKNKHAKGDEDPLSKTLDKVKKRIYKKKKKNKS